LILSLGLVLAGFGLIGAISGQVSAQVLAGAGSILAIYLRKLRPGKPADSSSGLSSDPNRNTSTNTKAIEDKKEEEEDKDSDGIRQFLKDIQEQVRFGAPSEVGGYISNFAGLYYVLIVLAHFVPNSVVGYFQAASNVTVLISIFATSLGFALFAGFSKLHGSRGDTSLGFKYAVKYVSYLGAPLVFFLAAASQPIVLLVYGREFLQATPLVALISISNIPLILGQSVFPAYFNAIGKTNYTMIAFLADAAAAIVLAPLLGSIYGAVGMTFAMLGSNLVSGAVALILARRRLNARIDYKASSSALAASVVCYLSALAVQDFVSSNVSSPLVALAFQAIVFAALYLVLAPLFRVLNLEDVVGLRQSVLGFGRLGRPLAAVLGLEARITARLGVRKQCQ
jgi:hypothetical protein